MLRVNSTETSKWSLGWIIPHCNYQMCYWIVEKGDTYPTTAVRFEARVNPEKVYSLRCADISYNFVYLVSEKNCCSSSHTCGKAHLCPLAVTLPTQSLYSQHPQQQLSIKWKKGRDSQENVIECLHSKTQCCISSGSVKDSYVVSRASEL